MKTITSRNQNTSDLAQRNREKTQLKHTVRDFKNTSDVFGNQSYLIVHLLTLANLVIQHRHKKQRLFLFSIYLQLKMRYLYSELSTCSNTNVVQWWTHDNWSMQIYMLNLYKQRGTYLIKCVSIAYNLTMFLWQDVLYTSYKCTRRRSVRDYFTTGGDDNR